MVKNNIELTRFSAQVLERFDRGEIDPKKAAAYSLLITNVQKGYYIDAMKHKMGIDLLPSEERPGLHERSTFVKKV